MSSPSLPSPALLPIQLLALDLDGTLVRDNLTIDSKVHSLLHNIQAKGTIKVVVATGRMHPSAKIYADKLGITQPIISYQGSMVCAQDVGQTRLHHQPISFDMAERLWAFLDTEKFHTNTYIENQLYTHATNPFLDLYRSLSGLEPNLINNWQDVPLALRQQGPTKLMVIDEERMPQLIGGLKEHFGDAITYFMSRSNFCEIIAPNVSKWSAVWWLAQQWNIPQHAIMCCGDQENDAAMIEAAGIGVAMGNAPDHIKALANVIAPHVDDAGLTPLLSQLLDTGTITLPEGRVRRGG
ncbi:MAG: Cof-type HAD-IIB family hydrolase [Vampirovibrionales bacterium]|nr:Cof-type HAD-IIB family hydrolase [Vampirovibrionales bacterium]